MQKLDPDNMPSWISPWWNRRFYDDVVCGVDEDDCAILDINGNNLVITTDFLNASPIAVEYGICGLRELGYLLVGANLADLCGTGAKPIAMLVGLTMERSAPESEFKELMEGVKEALFEYEVPLVGGDTKLGKSKALLGVAVGIQEAGSKLFPKSGAKIGDDIWVSGKIGSTSASVNGYRSEQTSPEWKEWAKKALLKPMVPIDKSLTIAKRGFGNGGTDLSDGLGSDILDMCKASKVGAIIEAESIPVDEKTKELALIKGKEPWIYPFVIGGDFQFVITSSPVNESELRDLGMSKIGKVIEADLLIQLGSKQFKLPDSGHRDSRGLSFEEEVESIINQFNEIADDQ